MRFLPAPLRRFEAVLEAKENFWTRFAVGAAAGLVGTVALQAVEGYRWLKHAMRAA